MILANALRVFSALSDWLGCAEPNTSVWLATVVETYGSSPRPPGSLMALRLSENRPPEIVGSISGGCLEQDLIARLQGEKGASLPRFHIFGRAADEQTRYRLPCGGSLKILLEPLIASATNRQHCTEIVDALEQRRPVTRNVFLADARLSIDNRHGQPTAQRHSNGRVGVQSPVVLKSPVVLQSPVILKNPVIVVEKPAMLSHRLCPDWRLLILGAGEVAAYLASFASAANFQVSVCEPRPEYAASWCGSAPLLRKLPDELIIEAFSDAHVAIVGVSHDPRVDDMGLMVALDSDAFFVGCMGSSKTSAARRERLRELGVSDSSLQRLKAPVGLDIGSKTPAEIAIAIVAELIDERNIRQAQWSNSDVSDCPSVSACQLSNPARISSLRLLSGRKFHV
jgi:xanthine dehydrogenase accessory factor